MLTFPLKPSSDLPQLLSNYSYYTNNTYQAILSLNNTGQNLSLIVDTASSWLIISQNSIENEEPECENEVILTKIKGNKIEGKICKINFKFGSTVKNVQFFMSFQDFYQSHGVLGLGFSRLSNGYLPLVQQMQENEFSLFIGKNVGSTSVLTIGGFSEDYGEEKISDINAYPHYGYWEVSIENISMSNNKMNVFSFGILNSSSPALIFPEKIFEFILNEFQNILECKQLEFIVCNVTGFNITKLPNISFSIQSSEFVLPASTFSYCTEDECEFYITQKTGDNIILGLAFFLQFYLAFDLDLFLIQVYVSSSHAGSGAYYTLYIIGIIVLGVIVSIPLCFWMMLSKIKGVADQSPEYQRLTN